MGEIRDCLICISQSHFILQWSWLLIALDILFLLNNAIWQESHLTNALKKPQELLYFWYELQTHTIKSGYWRSLGAKGEGFKTRREGKKKCNTPNNIDGLETWPTLRSEISRLFLIYQESRISRYYSPSLFYMVTVCIIAVDMWIILYYFLAMFRLKSFFSLTV